jgi:hypothetical protein
MLLPEVFLLAFFDNNVYLDCKIYPIFSLCYLEQLSTSTLYLIPYNALQLVPYVYVLVTSMTITLYLVSYMYLCVHIFTLALGAS